MRTTVRLLVATVVLVVAIGGAAGCGGAIAGDPQGASGPATTATNGPTANPEAVTWMDRFCGTGNFLVDAASAGPPSIPADPAEALQVFSTQLSRLSGVLGTALIDYDWLRDHPVGDGEVVVALIYDDLADAKARLDVARSLLDGTSELTPELLGEVTAEMAKGLAPLQQAVTTLSLLDLPAELDEAADAAPNCNRPAAPSTTA